MVNQQIYILWAKHFEGAQPLLVAVYNAKELGEQERIRYSTLHQTYSTYLQPTLLRNTAVV
jgi:hypothetical protein